MIDVVAFITAMKTFEVINKNLHVHFNDRGNI